MEGVPVIDRFKDEYAFLSNFFPATVEYQGKLYPSVEHAYQAAKTLDEGEREVIRTAPTAGQAKKLGRQVMLRANWNSREGWIGHHERQGEGGLRLQVMEDLLRQKFSDEPFRSRLLLTEDAELVEANDWHDMFFGDCRCPQHIGQGGLNWLGRLLMKIRDEIRHAIDHEFVEGPRGVCIHPVPALGTEHHVPCGKMRILHERGKA